ncbi:MAG: hypothetical protein EBV34_20585, partial [Betaproteobacteria bacterium]|nr:hypothetical protein [Betaproteobacteria bacterium]
PPASVPDAASIPLFILDQKQKAPQGAFCFWVVVGAYLGSTPLNLTPTGQFMPLRMPAERC